MHNDYSLLDADLIEQVTIEAKNLRMEATYMERSNLNFNHLNSSTHCVYGQMTGYCFSTRAKELICLCAARVYTCNNSSNIIGTLNGVPKPENRGSFWSPIECFIDIDINAANGNNERLLEYLKGHTDELILEPYKG